MLVALKKKHNLEELEFSEVKMVVVKLGDNRFRISVDSRNNLVVNKYGGEDSAIHITPRVSNEIELT